MGHYTKLAAMALRLVGFCMFAYGTPMFVYALIAHFAFRPLDRVPWTAATGSLLYAAVGAALYTLSGPMARRIGQDLDQDDGLTMR